MAGKHTENIKPGDYYEAQLGRVVDTIEGSFSVGKILAIVLSAIIGAGGVGGIVVAVDSFTNRQELRDQFDEVKSMNEESKGIREAVAEQAQVVKAIQEAGEISRLLDDVWVKGMPEEVLKNVGYGLTEWRLLKAEVEFTQQMLQSFLAPEAVISHCRGRTAEDDRKKCRRDYLRVVSQMVEVSKEMAKPTPSGGSSKAYFGPDGFKELEKIAKGGADELGFWYPRVKQLAIGLHPDGRNIPGLDLVKRKLAQNKKELGLAGAEYTMLMAYDAYLSTIDLEDSQNQEKVDRIKNAINLLHEAKDQIGSYRFAALGSREGIDYPSQFRMDRFGSAPTYLDSKILEYEAEFLHYLYIALKEQGRHSEAISMLKKSFEKYWELRESFDGEHARASNGLAYMLVEMEPPDEAIDVVDDKDRLREKYSDLLSDLKKKYEFSSVLVFELTGEAIRFSSRRDKLEKARILHTKGTILTRYHLWESAASAISDAIVLYPNEIYYSDLWDLLERGLSEGNHDEKEKICGVVGKEGGGSYQNVVRYWDDRAALLKIAADPVNWQQAGVKFDSSGKLKSADTKAWAESLACLHLAAAYATSVAMTMNGQESARRLAKLGYHMLLAEEILNSRDASLPLSDKAKSSRYWDRLKTMVLKLKMTQEGTEERLKSGNLEGFVLATEALKNAISKAEKTVISVDSSESIKLGNWINNYAWASIRNRGSCPSASAQTIADFRGLIALQGDDIFAEELDRNHAAKYDTIAELFFHLGRAGIGGDQAETALYAKWAKNLGGHLLKTRGNALEEEHNKLVQRLPLLPAGHSGRGKLDSRLSRHKWRVNAEICYHSCQANRFENSDKDGESTVELGQCVACYYSDIDGSAHPFWPESP
jgi:tetratricopeptide (TPR) repeat protein